MDIPAPDYSPQPTEIDGWAYITHAVDDPDETPQGGVLYVTDRDAYVHAGRLEYFWIDPETIQFKEVKIPKEYQRRRVATALLRRLNHFYPHARINPGMRNEVGEAFMKHILASEKDKVASNGVLNVPLSTMRIPGFGGVGSGH